MKTRKSSVIVKNGIEYRRVASFRGKGAEEKAKNYVEEYNKRRGSNRNSAYIDWSRWVLNRNPPFLRKIGWTTYRVYVPTTFNKGA